MEDETGITFSRHGREECVYKAPVGNFERKIPLG
jgi:hypothetical protein